MAEFTRRLRWCLKQGDLTIGDLHHWFKRPRATVRRWVIDACVPRGPTGNHASLLLDLLESRIKSGRGFPIPPELHAQQRPGYIHEQRISLPKTYSARGRL